MWRPKTEEKGWKSPFKCEGIAVSLTNAYQLQMEHFCNIVRRTDTPVTSAIDGKKTLQATEAVFESARTGAKISLLNDD